MGRRLFFWELTGFLLTAALGTLLRLAGGWWSASALAAAFSAVNQSVWEQMKLLFFPVFLFSVAQMCGMGRNYPNFLAVRAASVLAGLLLVPVLFYTCSGVVGHGEAWMRSAALILADLGVFLLDGWLLRRGRFSGLWQQLLGLLALWALAFCFVWCTFRPGPLALWQDPVTAQAGWQAPARP